MRMFEISRRDLVLSAAGAYAAFGLAKPIAFIGAAEAQQAPAQSFRKYKVGDIEVISLFDGMWEKPHDENFIKGVNVEQTKASLKAAGLTDAHVPIPFTVLAVRTGGRLVLIDSGTGGGQVGGPKAGLLAQNMAAAGLNPSDVKTIVVSHFHPDHIFGLMAKDTNAQTFPEAEIIVPAAELKWWTQPVDSIPQPRRGLAQRIQATSPIGGTSRWWMARPRSRRACALSRRSATPRATPHISSAPAADNCSPPPTPPTFRRCS
jgi:Metallo-beta-lactamase superfamily